MAIPILIKRWKSSQMKRTAIMGRQAKNGFMRLLKRISPSNRRLKFQHTEIYAKNVETTTPNAAAAYPKCGISKISIEMLMTSVIMTIFIKILTWSTAVSSQLRTERANKKHITGLRIFKIIAE
jgi:hypothetical protein